jgi:hypothetical protein
MDSSTVNAHVRVYRTRSSGAAAQTKRAPVTSARLTARTNNAAAPKLPPLKLRVNKAK